MTSDVGKCNKHDETLKAGDEMFFSVKDRSL